MRVLQSCRERPRLGDREQHSQRWKIVATSLKNISGLETRTNRTHSKLEKRLMKACPWEALKERLKV